MNYFFITSLGRSGTKFLANLLNQTENVLCYHEPFKQDYVNLPLSYYSNNLKVLESNLNERFAKLEQKIESSSDYKYYGEVNSLLRYNTKWLKKNLNAKVVHVVRDAKKVIPSIYSRNVYKDGSSHLEIVPKNSSEYADKWPYMNRFDKICWYWMHTNEMLLNDVQRCFKFEELISDYQKFLELLNYLEIPIVSESIWKEEVTKPLNTSKKAVFRKKIKSILQFKVSDAEQIGSYDLWSEEMKASFNEICGETAKKMGYNV